MKKENKKLHDDFIKILKDYKKLLDKEKELCKFGITPEFFNDHHEVLRNQFKSTMSTEEVDWLDWWMFDADFGQNKNIANSVVINKRKYDLETYDEFVKFLFSFRNKK